MVTPSLRPTGLPEDFGTKDFRPASGPFCFMEQLCRLHDGLVLEAKGVKEHFWKPFIKKLFHKRVSHLLPHLSRCRASRASARSPLLVWSHSTE